MRSNLFTLYSYTNRDKELGLKKIIKKILKKNVYVDRTKEYWKKAASHNDEKVMDYICDGYTREDFEKSKESIVFAAKIPLTTDVVIMDLACGMGRLCHFVAPHVKKYIGIDFIPEMIEKAKEYNKSYTNAEFHVNDGKTLKIISDEEIDTVFCELAFQHMLKDVQDSYVKEVWRVLRFGGSFYIQIPRIEFYKDATYARTADEIKKMFNGFEVSEMDKNDAYALLKVVKLQK
ncbi:MAG: class I SAM-dependent methyltransferase [Nitrosotalea sp.]